jgi:hypothetical protein
MGKIINIFDNVINRKFVPPLNIPMSFKFVFYNDILPF